MEWHTRMKRALLLAGLYFLFTPPAHAGVPVTVTEGDIRLDASRFLPSLREQVELVNARCTTCHSLARVVEAIDTGRTTTGAPFDRYYIKSLIIKKKRNPAASFTAEEAKAIMQLFAYIQDNPAQYAQK